MTRSNAQYWEEADRDRKEGREPDAGWKRTYDVEVIRTDIEQTPSVINPLVGVIVVRELTSANHKEIILYNSQVYVHTVKVAPAKGGRWACISAERKTESYNNVPERDGPDPTGKVIDPTEGMRERVKAAQAGNRP